MKTEARHLQAARDSWKLPAYLKWFGIGVIALVALTFILAFIYFPAAEVAPNVQFRMDPGAVVIIPAGYAVAGDVAVADMSIGDIVLHWTKYDDAHPNTGEIVVFEQPARVRAISPAFVMQADHSFLVDLLKQEGCEAGCEMVHTDYWSGPGSPNTMGVWALYQP